jgi:hypothetical protein
MHAAFKELLNLRDGAPVAADVAQHVSTCAACQAQLGRLDELKRKLQQLPQYAPPPHVWRAIRAEMERASPRRSHRYAALSAAATVLIAVSLAVLQGPRHETAVHSENSTEAVTQLVTRSQQLEDLLQHLPPRPAVERAATSAAIDDLQSRIEMLDVQLSATAARDGDRENVRRLWDTRVQLLHSLIDVRYAESLRDVDGTYYSPYSGVI